MKPAYLIIVITDHLHHPRVYRQVIHDQCSLVNLKALPIILVFTVLYAKYRYFHFFALIANFNHKY